jgi:hypothetical protein
MLNWQRKISKLSQVPRDLLFGLSLTVNLGEFLETSLFVAMYFVLTCQVNKIQLLHNYHHHHHHHVQEGLVLIPVPCILKMKLALHLFLGRPTCLRPFGLYCSACLGLIITF